MPVILLLPETQFKVFVYVWHCMSIFEDILYDSNAIKEDLLYLNICMQ